MLRIRKLKPEEFAAYRDIAVKEYQQDLIEHQYLSAEEALTRSEASMNESFPDGYIPSYQILQCIELPEDGSGDKYQLIGYVWYKLQQDASAFLLDFYIFDAFQNKGYGKQVMTLIESQLKEKKVKSFGLRVAPKNDRAIHLYEAAGFKAVGINMTKSL